MKASSTLRWLMVAVASLLLPIHGDAQELRAADCFQGERAQAFNARHHALVMTALRRNFAEVAGSLNLRTHILEGTEPTAQQILGVLLEVGDLSAEEYSAADFAAACVEWLPEEFPERYRERADRVRQRMDAAPDVTGLTQVLRDILKDPAYADDDVLRSAAENTLTVVIDGMNSIYYNEAWYFHVLFTADRAAEESLGLVKTDANGAFSGAIGGCVGGMVGLAAGCAAGAGSGALIGGVAASAPKVFEGLLSLFRRVGG